MTRTDKDVKAGWVTWFCARVSAFFLRMRSTNLLRASDEQMADGVDGSESCCCFEARQGATMHQDNKRRGYGTAQPKENNCVTLPPTFIIFIASLLSKYILCLFSNLPQRHTN